MLIVIYVHLSSAEIVCGAAVRWRRERPELREAADDVVECRRECGTRDCDAVCAGGGGARVS